MLVAARQEAARVQEAEAEAVRPLETWTKQQLQQWLREEQQYAGGTKRELVERAYALLAAADEEEEEEDTEGSDDLGPPVEEWSKAELRQWLREEQQYDGGSRDELVARVVGILEARDPGGARCRRGTQTGAFPDAPLQQPRHTRPPAIFAGAPAAAGLDGQAILEPRWPTASAQHQRAPP